LSGTILVTGCDERHDDLAADLLESLADGRDFAVGFVRMGRAPPPEAVAAACDHLVQLDRADPALTAEQGFQFALMGVKARLPDLFPGFDTYVWMDADTWVQNPAGVRQIVRAASMADVAAAPESDPNYYRVLSPNDYTRDVYATIYGEAEARRWERFPMVNGGVVAARAGSPLWAAWKGALEEARDLQAGRDRRFYSDQIPLHRLIASGAISLYPLRAVNNWIVLQAPPLIDFNSRRLRAPTLPWEEINILHLVGWSKTGEYPLPDGRAVSFRYRRIRALLAEGPP